MADNYQTCRSPRESKLSPQFADFLHKVRNTEGVIDAWPGLRNVTYVKLQNYRLVCVRNLSITSLHQHILEMGTSSSRSRSASESIMSSSPDSKTSSISSAMSVPPACSSNIKSYTMRRNSDSGMTFLNVSKNKGPTYRRWKSLEAYKKQIAADNIPRKKLYNNRQGEYVLPNDTNGETFYLDLETQSRNGDSQYSIMSKYTNQACTLAEISTTVLEKNGTLHHVHGPVLDYLDVNKSEAHSDTSHFTSTSELSDDEHERLEDPEWDTDEVFLKHMNVFNFRRCAVANPPLPRKRPPVKHIFQRRCSMDSQISFQENRPIKKKKSKRTIKIARPGHKHAMYISGADTLGGLPEDEIHQGKTHGHPLNVSDKNKLNSTLHHGHSTLRPRIFRTSSCPIIFEGSESDASSSETKDQASRQISSDPARESHIDKETLNMESLNQESSDVDTLFNDVTKPKRRIKTQKHEDSNHIGEESHIMENPKDDTGGSTSELMGVTFIVSGRSNVGQRKRSDSEKTRPNGCCEQVSTTLLFVSDEDKKCSCINHSNQSAFSLPKQRVKPRHFKSQRKVTTSKPDDCETKIDLKFQKEKLPPSKKMRNSPESDATFSDSSDCISSDSCLSDVSSKTRLDSQEESDSFSDCNLLPLIQQQERFKCY